MWQTSANFLPWLLTLVQKQQGFLASGPSHSSLALFGHLYFLLVSENEFSAITLSFLHVLEAHEQSLTEVHAVPKC